MNYMKQQKITIEWMLETEEDRQRCIEFRKILLNNIANLEDSTKVNVYWVNENKDESLSNSIGRNAKPQLENLSRREREVTYLLCENHSIKRIAEQLFISENTVKKHIQNIKGKLELKDNGMELVFQLKLLCS
jgi:DNA-binding NarL/FixJ family response regulator